MPQQADDDLMKLLKIAGGVLGLIYTGVLIAVAFSTMDLNHWKTREAQLSVEEKEKAAQESQASDGLQSPSTVPMPQTIAKADEQSAPKQAGSSKGVLDLEWIHGVPSPLRPVPQSTPAPARSETPRYVPKRWPDVEYIPAPSMTPEPAYSVPMSYALASNDQTSVRTMERHRIGNRREIHSYRQRMR